MVSHARCRNFHSTTILFQRRKPRHENIKASDMGLIQGKAAKPPTSELFRSYSDEEKAMLAKRYTPEQIRAIEAGENAVRVEDLDRQGVIRTDIGALNYLDDFRHYRSLVDKKPPDNTPVDPNARFMTEEELAISFQTHYEKVKKENPPPPPKFGEEEVPDELDPTRLNFFRADKDSPRYMGTNGPIPAGPNMLAPAIPKNISLDGAPEPLVKDGMEQQEEQNRLDPRDPEGKLLPLSKQSGLPVSAIFQLKRRVLVNHFVTNMTRLGRVNSFYCLAIAGNENGVLGIGQAKGQNAEATRNLAMATAVLNMKPIPRYEGRTIYGESEAKVSAVKVKLMPRPPGK